MAREKFQTLTEQMFYVLLCLRKKFQQFAPGILPAFSALFRCLVVVSECLHGRYLHFYI